MKLVCKLDRNFVKELFPYSREVTESLIQRMTLIFYVDLYIRNVKLLANGVNAVNYISKCKPHANESPTKPVYVTLLLTENIQFRHQIRKKSLSTYNLQTNLMCLTLLYRKSLESLQFQMEIDNAQTVHPLTC